MSGPQKGQPLSLGVGPAHANKLGRAGLAVLLGPDLEEGGLLDADGGREGYAFDVDGFLKFEENLDRRSNEALGQETPFPKSWILRYEVAQREALAAGPF